MQAALVTGASRGIGKAIAIRLCALGYQVFLCGRDAVALRAVVRECDGGLGRAAYLAGDLTDHSYIDAAIAAAQHAFGQIDLLINNAGTASRGPVQTADLDAWDVVLALNFSSALYLSRCVLPGMVKREAGAIINISSLSGRNTEPGSAIYSATKHALNGFGGCMFEDVRDYGIKVSNIMPGFVETSLTTDLGKNSAHMLAPDDVADAVEFVLSSSARCCPTEVVLRPQRRP